MEMSFVPVEVLVPRLAKADAALDGDLGAVGEGLDIVDDRRLAEIADLTPWTEAARGAGPACLRANSTWAVPSPQM